MRCATNQDAITLTANVIQMSILFLGIIGNSLVIVAHWKDPFRVFKNTTSLFVRNIAIIDIIVAFLWIIRLATILGGRKLEALLVIWLCFTVLSPCAFLCLAIERFLSIAFPLWHRARVTTHKCRQVIIGTWIVNSSIFILTKFINDTIHGDFILLLSIVFFLCSYAFYFATYVALRRQRNEFRKRQDISESVLNAMKARQKNQKRFLVTIAVVCFMLTVTFLPVVGMRMITVLLEKFLEGKRIRQINEGLLVLLSINFLINPIIYLLRLPKYSKTFKVLYCNFT